jgi:hypothetical protein
MIPLLRGDRADVANKLKLTQAKKAELAVLDPVLDGLFADLKAGGLDTETDAAKRRASAIRLTDIILSKAPLESGVVDLLEIPAENPYHPNETNAYTLLGKMLRERRQELNRHLVTGGAPLAVTFTPGASDATASAAGPSASANAGPVSFFVTRGADYGAYLSTSVIGRDFTDDAAMLDGIHQFERQTGMTALPGFDAWFLAAYHGIFEEIGNTIFGDADVLAEMQTFLRNGKP